LLPLKLVQLFVSSKYPLPPLQSLTLNGYTFEGVPEAVCVCPTYVFLFVCTIFFYVQLVSIYVCACIGCVERKRFKKTVTTITTTTGIQLIRRMRGHSCTCVSVYRRRVSLFYRRKGEKNRLRMGELESSASHCSYSF